MNEKSASPGLCLVMETRDDPDGCARIVKALHATSAVTLVLTPPSDEAALAPDRTRALVKQVQDLGIAVLFLDDAEKASETEADGVHLTSRPDIEVAYGIARGIIGSRGIVGVEAGLSRHDAMSLGEAGADYIAFGSASGDESADDEQIDFIAWWSNLFVVPCVAFGVETAEQAAQASIAGADFIAVRPPADLADDAIADWARSVAEAVHVPSNAA
jgi:thiamine-phosphate pyrophosphorylase